MKVKELIELMNSNEFEVQVYSITESMNVIEEAKGFYLDFSPSDREAIENANVMSIEAYYVINEKPRHLTNSVTIRPIISIKCEVER